MKSKIEKLTNHELMDYFDDAIRDDHYQPTAHKCNHSGFSSDELKTELLRRLENVNPKEDDTE